MDVKLFAFFLTILFVTAVGFAFGFILKAWLINRKKGNLEEKLSTMRVEAQNEIAQLQERANTKAQETRDSAQSEVDSVRAAIAEKEKHARDREELLDERQRLMDKTEEKLQSRREKIDEQEKNINEVEKQSKQKLVDVSGISPEDARESLFKEVEKEAQDALFSRSAKLERENNETITTQAKEVLVTAIQRYGNAVDNDIMSTYVNIGDDELKGKIIGKEGRNIKAFEKI